MPSVSGKQHRLMEAVAHDAGFAKKAGVPQSVGEEFAKADEGKKPKRSRVGGTRRATVRGYHG